MTESLHGIRSDWVLYVFVAAYAAISVVFVASKSQLNVDALFIYVKVWLTNYGLIFPFVLLCAGGIRITLRLDQRRRLAYRHMFNPKRVGRFIAGTVLFIAILVFVTSFTSVKNAISANTPFVWDAFFANIDKILHFNNDPWQLLYAVGQHELVLKAVEFNYNVLWFIANYAFLYWVAVSPRANHIRSRYMLGFFLTWALLGSLLAAIFLSAGPAFYGHITGDTARFAAQLDFLAGSEGANSSAVAYQNYLWSTYQSGKASIGSGISAFPSVHVGLVMLNALFVWELNRKLGLVAFAYVFIIVLSSVYLAWHYAVDGYFSILVVLFLYLIMKKAFVYRWHMSPLKGEESTPAKR